MAEVEIEDARTAARMLRALHGWSQAELAEQAGLDVSSVQRFEAGQAVAPGTLLRLSEGAGVPEAVLHHLFLPLVRYLRDLKSPRIPDPRDRRPQHEKVAEAAGQAAEQSAAATRAAFLRAWSQHVRETLEEAANAWRPKEADRELAPDRWGRLEPLPREGRDLFLSLGDDFHGWALVEWIADLAVDTLEIDPELALERADLACQISNLTPGSEPWKARVRGYALAARSKVLRKSGDAKGAREAKAEASRLWAAGMEEPGLLSEERFREALGAGGPG